MSNDTQAADTPKKKKGGLLVKLLLVLVLIGAGGGGAFGLMAAGIIGGGSHAEEKKPQGPQLVLKDEEDPYAPPAGKGEEEGIQMVYGEGGSKYRTAYFDFGDDFTSNLKNSDALVQLSLAASTQRDGRVLMWLKEHQTAIRSRMLIEIANTGEDEVFSPDGKERLQKRLAKAINDVLIEREGFGGVDKVYFRSFIVQ